MMFRAFDTTWLYRLNGWMVDPLCAKIFTFIALWGILYFLIVGLYIWYRPYQTKEETIRAKQLVVMLCLAVVAALLIVNIFDVLTPRARPFVTHNDIVAVNVLVDPTSFPSLHVAMTFAFSAMLLLLNRRTLGWISFAVAILIGLSRVVTGVHYPTDIIGGMIVGFVAAAIVCREAKWLHEYLPEGKKKS